MTEKQIETDIISALRTLGFLVTKTSQPRPSMVTKGIPDLYARHATWGIRLWIEVKTAKGKVSLDQFAWHACEVMSGGNPVLVARSTGEVLEHLKSLGAPIR